MKTPQVSVSPDFHATQSLKTLCLDIGTDTGISLTQGPELLSSGTLQLATDEELEQQRREGKERTLDVRFVRTHAFLTRFIREGVARIVFEDVEFVSTRMQTQLWASLRTAIWTAILEHPHVRVFGVPVSILKQFATGNGHAQKLEMAQALAKQFPASYALEGEFVRKADGALADDNEVDAIWLALYTQAVDRGERCFLSVYQRKLLEAAERREKRAQRRQKAKAKRAAALAQAKAKKQAITAALKSLGRCCGVFRKYNRARAVCPKCGSRTALHLPAAQLGGTPASETPRLSAPDPGDPADHTPELAGSFHSAEQQ